MKVRRMRTFVAYVSIFGSLGLYSEKCAYRLTRDGTIWKAVEPQTLLHGIVISKERFLKSLPSQAPKLPPPWSDLHKRSARMRDVYLDKKRAQSLKALSEATGETRHALIRKAVEE